MSETETPTLMTRIAGIWNRETETAKGTYARLLKRSELDGKELSDRETAELAEAMRLGGIPLEKAASHRELCQRLLQARPVAAGLQAARKDAETAQAAWDKLAEEIGELQKRQHALYLEHDAANLRARAAEAAEATIANCTGELAEIGITV